MGKKIKENLIVQQPEVEPKLTVREVVRLIKAVHVIDKCKYNSREILFERLAKFGYTEEQAVELFKIYTEVKN